MNDRAETPSPAVNNCICRKPRQVMGFRDLILFYIVTGISLRWIATAATVGASAVVIWLIAWLTFYVPLALAVVELSSRYPQEGGLYVWTKRAFGETSGFVAGWTYWASNLPYYPAVLYFAASNALYIGPRRWQVLADNKAYFLIFALLGLALGTFLNVVGLSVGRWLHNLGAIGTWLPIGILIGIAAIALRRFGSATSFSSTSIAPHLHFRDLLFLATIIFALGGSESASFLGDEVRDARRNLPRGLLCGGVFVTIGYIVGTIAVLVSLPSSEVNGLQGIMQAISKAAERVGLGGIAPLAALLITVSNLGALGAWLAVSARIPFVAGLDRYLPAPFARIHAKWGTPHVALLVQAAFGVVFILLGQAGTSVYGAYEILVSMGVISYFLPYLFVFAALIRLQHESPETNTIRIPGGTPMAVAIGILGFATTLATIVFSLMPAADEPHPGLAIAKIVGLTAVLLGMGIAVFAWGKSHARSAG